ncbi:MAG TPA: efflux RND transporter periplasmic adaptor subunit [Sphingomicrobium sp.]|nr:efflux RND transporter periplasmic adaptor subunit [Sphingomicrobium sp.]
MNDMNLEAPIRTDESETLVVTGDRARRRKRLAIVGAAIIAVVAIVIAIMVAGGAGEGAAAGAEEGEGRLPTVSVVVPGRTQVSNVITASGALAARRDQPIGVPGEGGQVTRVFVDSGSWVRQGQVLATIERSVQTQEAAQLAAQLEAARADARLAQNEYDRALALVGRGFISHADVDRKQAARDAAAARVRVVQAQLNAARARIGRLNVRAPTSGLILDRNVEVGQVVGPGSGALFRLALGGDMEMRAQLSQHDIAAINVGMPATVIPTGTDGQVQGRVWQVSPVIDPQSRQGEVRIAIPFARDIRPGGFAEARIIAGATTAPLLPQSAVLSDARGNYVYVINEKDQAERRDVVVGTVDDRGVTIAQGLSGQERVVSTAGPFLNTGQKVQPRRQAAAAALATPSE